MSKLKVSFFPRLICFLVLVLLIVSHVIPLLPILEILILYVVLFRPRWFKKLVDRIYSNKYINHPKDLD
jgi:uncharacterized membrane protein YbaN (DUF454 family)